MGVVPDRWEAIPLVALPDGSGLRIPDGGIPANAAVVGRRGLVGTAAVVAASGTHLASLRVELLSSSSSSVVVRAAGRSTGMLPVAVGHPDGSVTITTAAPEVPLSVGDRIVSGNLSPHTSPPDGVPVAVVTAVQSDAGGSEAGGSTTATIGPVDSTARLWVLRRPGEPVSPVPSPDSSPLGVASLLGAGPGRVVVRGPGWRVEARKGSQQATCLTIVSAASGSGGGSCVSSALRPGQVQLFYGSRPGGSAASASFDLGQAGPAVTRVVVVLRSGRQLEATVATGQPTTAGGAFFGVEYVDTSRVASVVAFDAAGRQTGRSEVP